jgi:hypothetical protein
MPICAFSRLAGAGDEALRVKDQDQDQVQVLSCQRIALQVA